MNEFVKALGRGENELARLYSENDKLRAEIERLQGVVQFYADPESYHAVAFLADRPAGEFADDFNEDEWVKECGYDRPMPGAKARTALGVK